MEEQKSLQDIQNKSQGIGNILKNLDKEMEAMSQNATNESANINTKFNEIRNYLKQREQHLLSQVQNAVDDKTKKLQDTKKCIG